VPTFATIKQIILNEFDQQETEVVEINQFIAD
jgi:hypothetical protein